MKQTRVSLPHGDVRLAFRDSGGDLGPVVFGPRARRQPARVQARGGLSDRARVITYDQRGHGASTISDRGDYSFNALIADLRAVVDHLELRQPVLVGHSLGAGVALCAAATIPDCGGLVALDGALPVRMLPPDRDRARRAARAPSLVLARALMRALRVGSAISIEQMQAIAEDLLTRGDEFEHALRSLACPARYLLGSRVGPGPDCAAALEAARMGARRVSEIDPAIEVAWLDTGHAIPRTMPPTRSPMRRWRWAAPRSRDPGRHATIGPVGRLARAPAAAVTIAEKPAPWSSATTRRVALARSRWCRPRPARSARRRPRRLPGRTSRSRSADVEHVLGPGLGGSHVHAPQRSTGRPQRRRSERGHHTALGVSVRRALEAGIRVIECLS